MENLITDGVTLNFPQRSIEAIACLNDPDWPVGGRGGGRSGTWEMAQRLKALDLLAWQPAFGL